MPLRNLPGFINPVFKFVQLPLSYPHYSCISKRTKTINVTLKTQNKGSTHNLAIDSTGLKAYGERRWEVTNHGIDGKQRVWRKLHVAIDINTHKIIAAALSGSHLTNSQELPSLARRKINKISADGA
ncbi:Mobile element protein [Candidatus Enterovibrio altilux]|uniref:Mobile element protein n=1 Tax=Candidatus Enterovibrio altilux TaxID=1927128 RepID=A0A291B985_9GAMM|nr:Mobile element protein [Candidatus Enterovibrio luxaltus]